MSNSCILQGRNVGIYAALLGVIFLADSVRSQGSGQGRSLKIPGDIILGGLFPVHRRSNTTENSCAQLYHELYQLLASMIFALEEINNDSRLLPNITLGAEIYDTCGSQTIAVDGAKELIRYTLRNKTSPLAAVIGSFRSDESIAVANILRIFDIPQVSYASTSPELSNKKLYSFFFRTVPADSFQAKAMVDVVKRVGWTYVLTVYSPGRYGQQGMERFYEEAERVKICIASKIKVPDDPTEEDYKTAIRKLVETRKSTDKGQVDVVILFCTHPDLEGLLRAAKQMLRGEIHFTWISSETWGSGDVSKGSEEIAAGALTTDFLGGKVKRFNKYFLSRNLRNNKYGKWFEEFWQQAVNCDLPEKSGAPSKFSRKCRDNDTIPQNYNMATVGPVINAVYVVAHALDDMRKDICPVDNGLCSRMRKLKGEDMLRYLRNATFPDASYNIPLRFNQNQEVDGSYTVLNFRKTSKGQYRSIQVGTWDGVLTKYERIEGSLVINKSNIDWGRTGENAVPASYCSSKCKTKQIRIHGRFNPWCCWHCEDCSTRSVVTNNSCQSCPRGYQPVNNKCKEVPIVYPSWTDSAAKVVTIFTSLGLLATLATALFFVVNRNHPAIKAAGRELCTILFAGVLSCHVAALLYFVKPNPALCTARRFASTVSMTMCYAPVLLRTSRIYRIFKSAQSSVVPPSFISPASQIVAACSIVAVQVSITLVWVVAERRPYVVQDYQYDDYTFLACNSNDKTLAVSLSYNAMLMLISTVYAFKTRSFPQNYNEAKYIAISMYVSCSVWVIFIPCYLNAKDSAWKNYFSSGRILLIGAITLAGLLVPKIFLVTSQNGSEQNNSTLTATVGPANKNAIRPDDSAKDATTPNMSIEMQTCNWKKCMRSREAEPERCEI